VYGYEALRRGMKNGSGILAKAASSKNDLALQNCLYKRVNQTKIDQNAFNLVGLPFGKIPTFIVDVWL
jgi:hypothetical protein